MSKPLFTRWEAFSARIIGLVRGTLIGLTILAIAAYLFANELVFFYYTRIF
mgnify:CR=1 FL=1